MWHIRPGLKIIKPHRCLLGMSKAKTAMLLYTSWVQSYLEETNWYLSHQKKSFSINNPLIMHHSGRYQHLKIYRLINVLVNSLVNNSLRSQVTDHSTLRRVSLEVEMTVLVGLPLIRPPFILLSTFFRPIYSPKTKNNLLYELYVIISPLSFGRSKVFRETLVRDSDCHLCKATSNDRRHWLRSCGWPTPGARDRDLENDLRQVNGDIFSKRTTQAHLDSLITDNNRLRR